MLTSAYQRTEYQNNKWKKLLKKKKNEALNFDLKQKTSQLSKILAHGQEKKKQKNTPTMQGRERMGGQEG